MSLTSTSWFLWLGRTQLGLGLWSWLEAPAPALGLSPLAPSLNLLSSFRVQVEFYVNENTFKERLKLFFIKNQRSSESGTWSTLVGEGWAGIWGSGRCPIYMGKENRSSCLPIS